MANTIIAHCPMEGKEGREILIVTETSNDGKPRRTAVCIKANYECGRLSGDGAADIYNSTMHCNPECPLYNGKAEKFYGELFKK